MPAPAIAGALARLGPTAARTAQQTAIATAAISQLGSESNRTASSVLDLSGHLADLDDQAKSARGLGIYTDDLREMQLAADMSGLPNLNKTLERQQARLGQAIVEGGRYEEMLNRIGLTSAELDRLDPTSALLRQVEALQRVRSQNERAFLSREVLGVRSVKGLADLAEATETARRHYERFNLGLGDTGAVERANDSWRRVSELFSNLGGRLADRFAPLVERSAEVLLNFLDRGDRFERFARLAETGVSLMVGAFTELIDTLDRVDRIANSVQETLGSFLGGGTFSPLEALDRAHSRLFGGNGVNAAARASGAAGAGERFSELERLNVGAATRGSREAFSTLFSVFDGNSADERTARATEETVSILKGMASQRGQNIGIV